MNKKYIVSKMMTLVLTLIIVTLLSFLLMRLSPIDPATAYVKRNSVMVTQEQIDEARIKLGLDKPLIIQYANWVKDAIRGDLGISLASGKPVVYELSKAVPISLGVVAISALIMIIGVVFIGALQYILRETILGKIITIISIICVAIPAFYLAILFIKYFAYNFDFMSISGNTGIMKYLPSAICLSISGIGFYSQMLEGSLEREMSDGYAVFARCRGLSEKRILFFHALPHAVTDLVPSFAQMIGLCLAGATIVERVFSLPGLGYLIIDSVVKRDAPVIHASVLFLAFVLVFLDLMASILVRSIRSNMSSREVA